jgi:hypothetical protein
MRESPAFGVTQDLELGVQYCSIASGSRAVHAASSAPHQVYNCQYDSWLGSKDPPSQPSLCRCPFNTRYILEANVSNQPIVPLVLKAVGLAMGVAVVVLGVLKAGTVETYTALLGVGLFSLSLWAFQKGR